ncbi:MAG: S8 family serine peptidase [Prevotella sp.]|nr:S8 family serine peptidase [Prevotella sp.]MBQ8991761.1 S8 family serine peptidase [Prevotella sp.]
MKHFKQWMLAAILTVSGVTSAQAQANFSPQASAFKNKYQSQAEVAKTRGEQVPMAGPFVVTCKMNYSAIGVGEQLEKLGAEVLTAFGRSVVVNIPADQFDAVAKTEGVLLIDVGSKAQMKTDVTRRVTKTDEVQTGTGAKLPQAYTGKGVIIGLIDTGFDFTHPVFKDKDGNLRIKAVYLGGNETVKGESVTVTVKDATGASKKVDLPSAIITDPKVILDTTRVKDDTRNHGTHCAAIAAGRQIENVTGLTGNLLGGMAPEAELILCTNQLGKEWQKKFEDEPDANVLLDSYYLYYMSHYAEKQGKPLVMSYSMNSHNGPHNGTSPGSMMIGDWCKQGNVMMLCAGNEGGDNIYVNETIASGDSINFAMEPLQGKLAGYYYLKTNEPVKVRVGIYDLQAKKEVNVFPYTIDTGKQKVDTILYIGGKDDPEIAEIFSTLSEKGKEFYAPLQKYIKSAYCRTIVATGTMMESHLSDKLVNITKIELDGIFVPKTIEDEEGNTIGNQYGFTLHIIPSAKTELFSWIDLMRYHKNGIFVEGNATMSMGDWNTCGEPVSVGAWTANNHDKSLVGEVVDPRAEIGDIASFSSYGTDYAGHKHPTACTPGHYVYSALNSFTNEEYPILTLTTQKNQFEGQKDGRIYYFGSASGTSMATPAAAGIVALWMQAAKDKGKTLTNKDIKDIIAKTADNDDFTKAKPERFGYGKINAYKGLLYVLDLYDPTGISTVSTHQPENVNFRLNGDNLYAEGAEDGTPVSLYDLSGVLVRQTSVEGGIVSLAGLQRGVYAVQLGKLGSTLIRK